MRENILADKVSEKVIGKKMNCRVCGKIKKFKKFTLPVRGETATREMCLKCYLAIKEASIVERRKIIPIDKDVS